MKQLIRWTLAGAALFGLPAQAHHDTPYAYRERDPYYSRDRDRDGIPDRYESRRLQSPQQSPRMRPSPPVVQRPQPPARAPQRPQPPAQPAEPTDWVYARDGDTGGAIWISPSTGRVTGAQPINWR
jgi:hypothetical protein